MVCLAQFFWYLLLSTRVYGAAFHVPLSTRTPVHIVADSTRPLQFKFHKSRSTTLEASSVQLKGEDNLHSHGFARKSLRLLVNTLRWILPFGRRNPPTQEPLSVVEEDEIDKMETSAAPGAAANFVDFFPNIGKELVKFATGKSETGKKKVLILMSDTGGGHRASAIALDQALEELFPGEFEVEVVDIWTNHGSWPFNRFVPSYRFLAKKPFLWRLSYAYARFPPTRIATEILSGFTCYQSFRRLIESSNPDMVVSVHPLCQHLPVPIVKRLNSRRDSSKLPISFITIVTDLGGAHETWFHRGVDKTFVPSSAVEKIAKKQGIKPENIIKHGLPIRPPFWKEGTSKRQTRKALGIEENSETVLLMGGGDGVGGLNAIAGAISDKLRQINRATQIIVVCGNNEAAQRSLKNTKWPSNVNVVVKGFCDNVDELMAASDCLVTKAGPGTIAEGMSRGLPIVLSSFLPGQEEGNVPYVTEKGIGVYSGNKPDKIAAHVKNILEDGSLRDKMSRLSSQYSNPQATCDIARDLAKILNRQEFEMGLFESKAPSEE